MKNMLRCPLSVLFVVVTSMGATLASDEDWPAYRKDAARSGITNVGLDFPLGRAWVRHMSRAPRPAWPEAGRSFSVFEFDHAFMPVVADGLVYLSSSADDSVHAMDARDGSPRWTYTTGAPVRCAPHIAHGRCYFSSDDGWVYSLDAKTGEVIWTFQAALDGRMFIGNERVISRQPSRSGTLVEGDTLYVVGGMWPSEGVVPYALDA
ncbi:MAG: PQQ-binding-like beta-propeller repeat protein, partial [Planctomycetota bacterium]